MHHNCQKEAWFAAIDAGDIEIVKAYVAGMSKTVDGRGLTSLMHAAMGNHPSIIQLLMTDGLRKKDSWGRTALMFSAMSGSVIATEILISAEATIADFDGMTALMYAVFHKNLEIAQLLVPYEQRCATKHAAILQLSNQSYEIGAAMTALMIAAVMENAECVELLANVEAGCIDCNGETALYKAVKDKYLPAIKILAPLEFRKRTSSGYSPLYLAVQLEFLPAIEILAPYEDDDCRYGTAEETALMIAVAQRNKAAVEVLAPTLHSEYSRGGLTALVIAARENLPDICKVLIPYEFGLITQQGHKTALMVAAELGHVECVQLLAEHEAGMRTDAGETALMLAARRGHLECVNILVSYEQCAVNKHYQTALMLATVGNHFSVASALMKYERCIQNDKGQTALMMAVMQQNAQIVELLAPHEAKVFDAQHQTALMIAANSNIYDLVAILMQYESGLTDCDARTSLMFAAEKNYYDLVPLLIDTEHGKLDRFGRSALFIAAQNNNTQIIRVLVHKEKKMVTTRRFRVEQNTTIYVALGSTALIYAVLYNKLEIAQILVSHEHGVVDSTGRCALHYAIERRNTDIISLLLPYENNIADQEGNTPLMLLTKAGLGYFVPTLINKITRHSIGDNSTLTATNKHGDTALSLAVSHGSEVALCVLYGTSDISFPFYKNNELSLLQLCESTNSEPIMQIFMSYFVERLSLSSAVIECMYKHITSVLLKEYTTDEEQVFLVSLLNYFFEYLFDLSEDGDSTDNPMNPARLIALMDYIKRYVDATEGNCNVCYNEAAVMLSLPCKHVTTCKTCWKRLEGSKVKRELPRCLVCRTYITCNIVLNSLDDKILCRSNTKLCTQSEDTGGTTGQQELACNNFRKVQTEGTPILVADESTEQHSAMESEDIQRDYDILLNNGSETPVLEVFEAENDVLWSSNVDDPSFYEF